ncbi:Bug family tripartite tricarboxylate transporter substrate binding protein [Comamonas endophytica]|uniref:Tripartite tricarboxylate transporter substrate binding protein n=1 Tax=Comamonas endophytica TaxID=2949090 RepID=A0ABY6G6Z8_9BURK|nr:MULTISPECIES: tripartite tricarboxylate transporter substrate binding protein [unclassified Acidovorax]MCD2511294.1 tripartite tricarboxylate transporter substrate binding protein [Acidovorax sp. D4N7]UYG50688.1 tripartite tricarboxylate transporter substrate binding protein [Acidovorax sp. 5MLIR]
MKTSHFASGFLACALALACTTSAAETAQDYPSKTVSIVVPFPTGGSTDLLARRVADKLRAAWGKAVIVENKPGAGGAVGAEYVAKAAGDGYTLLMGVTGSNAIAQSLYPNLRYHVINDFKPVTMLVSAPLVLAVNPNVKANSVKEYIALSKNGPRPLSFGSAGNGTSMHLTGEMFKQATGARLEHIPYRGNGPKVTDLLGGQIDSSFGDLLVLQPHLESGKLRALAVTSAQRNPILPNVPTVAESGFPGFEALSWQGLFAPAATPDAIVQKINLAVSAAVKAPDVQSFFAERGFVMEGNGSAAFTQFVKQETGKWKDIVEKSGARAD